MTPADLRAVIDAQPAGSPVRLAFDAGDDTGCARLLRETLAPREALRPMTSAGELMGLLSPASFAAVFDHPRFSDFRDTFNAGNRAGAVEWASAFTLRGLMTPAELAAVTAYLTKPVEQQLPLAATATADDVGKARGVTANG